MSYEFIAEAYDRHADTLVSHSAPVVLNITYEP